MKAQVLTTTRSASAGRRPAPCPSATSVPTSLSESTWFLGQPSVSTQGSLYNTMLILGPGGVLHRHRKLMPTMHERLFHGIGAGDDLDVVDMPGVGRVGGLICWENRMPLARWEVYQGGPQIWVAPTADDSDGWLASMRHIAIEAGVRGQRAAVHPAHRVPRGLPGLAARPRGPRQRSAPVIVDPLGEVIAGPLYDQEGIVFADCDLDGILSPSGGSTRSATTAGATCCYQVNRRRRTRMVVGVGFQVTWSLTVLIDGNRLTSRD